MKKIDRLIQYIEYKGLNDNKVTVDCGLSQGLLGQARKGKCDLGEKAIFKILNKYQDINRVWLLTGEGEMIKSNNTIINSPVGNNSTQIAGNSNSINCSSLDKAIDEIGEQRKLVAKSQEQIDRLLVIIEKMQK